MRIRQADRSEFCWDLNAPCLMLQEVLAWNSLNVHLEKAQWSEQASSREQYVLA